MRKNVVKQLTDIEHVRKRPGMYVGDVTLSEHPKWVTNDDGTRIFKTDVKIVPAILKLFDEIISNSIDEAFRTKFKYGNRISVIVEGDKITVTDNGRGISADIAPGSKDPQSVAAFTSLRAGANFSDDAVISIGTHGLGASLVNILSTKFDVTTCDGKDLTQIKCRDGMTKVASTFGKNTKKWTEVSFTPDFSLFGVNHLTDAHVAAIRKRVTDLAACFPDITFKFNKRVVKAKRFRDYLSMLSPLYELKEEETYKLGIFPSDEPDQISFVNGIDTYEGGTHIDWVRHKVVTELLDRLNKKYKKLNLKPADVRNKLTFVLISNDIPSPKFRSQTKEYLTNNYNEFSHIFDGVENDGLINRLLRHPEIIDPIIETKKLKLEAQERVNLRAQKRRAKKLKIPKHIAANGDPKQTILHICEGNSAVGQLCNVRDPDLHGGYPLRGKPLNVFGRKPTEIMKNTEFAELMQIIGLELNEPVGSLNYSKIRIMADADHDGNSIVGLLLNFFMLWPELYEQRRITIIKSPIVIATRGKTVKRFYDLQEYKDANLSSGWSIKYVKGLGSLSRDEYEFMINNPNEAEFELTPKSVDSLLLIFNNDSAGRKEWLLS